MHHDVNQFRCRLTEIGTRGFAAERRVFAPISVNIEGYPVLGCLEPEFDTLIFKENFHRKVNQFRYYTSENSGAKYI